jgi:ATP-dependent Lhr-like helicase
VVLDEIHLLDNTPRGDQLRILLNRLRRLRDKLQYCILSATIDDLDIGKRYFPDPQVCFLRTPREIEYMLMPHKDFIVKLLALAKERNWKKILAFFNARSHVETFSQGFNRPPFQDRVLVHHASLPKEQREVTEKIMNQSNQAILCATSTLELGIDIGDVDCVVLYRPPFDVSSLLQRIGRGNRRLNSMYAVGVYTNKWERMLFETLFESARQGSLYSKNYQPSLSVIPQQIYSYLYQRRRLGTTLKSLCRILVPPYTEGDVKSIFRKLVSDSCLIEFRPGIYFTGPALEKRITYGKIHSNIAEVSFGEYDVFDTAQGNRIGRVFHLQNIFILGGRCWQIVKILEKEKRVYAQYLRQAPGVAKIFEGKGAGSYHYLMAPVLKGKLFPELAGNEFPSARDGFNTYILHLFGWLNGFLLTEGLVKEGFEALDIEGKILNLHNFPLTEDKFPFPRSETIKTVIQDNITMLEDALGSGAFFYDLPTEHQIHDHYLGMDIDYFLTFLTRVKLREYPLAEFQKRIAVIK